MSGQQKQQYHCDRCGEVFRSNIKNISELICTECGEPPVRGGFAQLAQLPVLDHSLLDSNHGIAGKDEADFFSMERKKKQKRAIMMYVAWFLLLITGMTVGLYVKVSRNERAMQRASINKDSIEYEKRKSTALRACLFRFQAFATSNGENQKSEHIYNGTDYLVNIRTYYSDPLNREEYRNKKIRVVRSLLVEKEGLPNRLDVLLRIDHEDRYDQFFEAVFWQKDGQWYLDWPHFTRVGELNWTEYIQKPEINGEFQFRLYVRKRRSEFDDNNGYRELVFSKALNMKDNSSDNPTPVLVKRDTELEREILECIEQVIQRQLSDEDVLGDIDPSGGQARVNVRVGYEEVNGERVIVLKEVISDNWFSEIDKIEGDEELEETTK